MNNVLRISLILFIALLIGAISAKAQCPVMPAGTLCISQAAGNTAAAEHRELIATKEALAVRDAALLDKDKIIQDNKAEATKSINELKTANADLLGKLGTATGQVIGAQAEIVRNTAMIQFLLTNGRKKCGVSIFCIQL